MAVCEVCFRRCSPAEGERGACGARISRGGSIRPVYYGKLSSLALDPIEKKPLVHFYPGSMILSAGSLGCNLHCPFCQNHEIAQAEGGRFGVRTDEVSPEKLTEMAEYYRRRGNIGIAFTYNEPLVGYEFVRDTAVLVHAKGMKTVLVTNGTASLSVLEELLPHIDAMNVDLKGFTGRYYRHVLGGDLSMVRAFIERAVQCCHVELTTLIVPGENDTEEEMRQLSAWVAGLKDGSGNVIGPSVPLHVTRFFPAFHMTDRQPTAVRLVRRLAAAAAERLEHVYTGNC